VPETYEIGVRLGDAVPSDGEKQRNELISIRRWRAC
jgi:hypothetical protein